MESGIPNRGADPVEGESQTGGADPVEGESQTGGADPVEGYPPKIAQQGLSLGDSYARGTVPALKTRTCKFEKI